VVVAAGGAAPPPAVAGATEAAAASAVKLASSNPPTPSVAAPVHHVPWESTRHPQPGPPAPIAQQGALQQHMAQHHQRSA
jgi:hypothetical protein